MLIDQTKMQLNSFSRWIISAKLVLKLKDSTSCQQGICTLHAFTENLFVLLQIHKNDIGLKDQTGDHACLSSTFTIQTHVTFSDNHFPKYAT
ncbi:hypothetical protein LDENG_00207520 [Lucifuga dentata]|nr:hypothetical protein LDENG_00207520 [Lucifuga dentata]